MNNRIYRLLRSNKEQGPFTADELIQKGLKPFDLIWVDGRSAAWSYPGEIKEFKTFVPDTQQRDVSVMVKQESRISSAVQAAVAVNENLKQVATKKEKPRYKVSAAWSKIQTITTPAYNNVMVAEPKKSSANKLVEATGAQINSKSLSWQEAWQDWEKEKSTVPVKPQVVNLPKPVTKKLSAEPVLEKKFEQSLDTITDRYIDNLIAQKKKSKGFSFGKSSEFIVPSLALIIIFSVGYWLLHNDKIASALSVPTSTQQQPATNQSTPSNSNTVSNNNNNNQPETSTQNVVASQPVENNNIVKPEATDKKILHAVSTMKSSSAATTNPVTDSGTSNTNAVNASNTNVAKTNSATTDKQFDPSVINNVPNSSVYNDQSGANNGDLNAAEARPVRRRTNAGDDATTNTSTNNASTSSTNKTTTDTKSKSVINYVSVPQYVQMDGNGSGNLKIQNNSDLDLDLVVVDVQYYDASGRYRKGETLYLHNLKAGKTVNVKTSKDANSMYATSKVSVVSSEANGIYAVGDN